MCFCVLGGILCVNWVGELLGAPLWGGLSSEWARVFN
jgi:hypothetical protein